MSTLLPQPLLARHVRVLALNKDLGFLLGLMTFQQMQEERLSRSKHTAVGDAKKTIKEPDLETICILRRLL
jgi:hypothetical protein